jgi:hypothetical protein
VIPGFDEAVAFVLAKAQPGDLIVIKTLAMAQEIWNRLDRLRAGETPA